MWPTSSGFSWFCNHVTCFIRFQLIPHLCDLLPTCFSWFCTCVTFFIWFQLVPHLCDLLHLVSVGSTLMWPTSTGFSWYHIHRPTSTGFSWYHIHMAYFNWFHFVPTNVTYFNWFQLVLHSCDLLQLVSVGSALMWPATNWFQLVPHSCYLLQLVSVGFCTHVT